MKYIKNNITRLQDSVCTGCYACTFVCHKNAVSIVEKKGFLLACVDAGRCVNCGLCLTVCHRNCDEQQPIMQSDAYECYSNDEKVLASSTSGGAGYELSKYFICKGYKIIGCKYNYKKNCAEHDIVSEISDLYLFQGSKYIQSSLENIGEKLNRDDRYVFFGTPCQCYGLKNLFEAKKINAKEIIFIDFFCHGFIPADFFKKLVQKRTVNGELAKVEFRNKDRGWHSFLFKFTYKDNYAVYVPYTASEFGIVFLNDMLLLDSCYGCKFRFNKIASDIRIGDYWGTKHKENNSGVSCVLGASQKGKRLLKDFFNDSYMWFNKIDIQEIKDVKCGSNNGKKKRPLFNNFLRLVYEKCGMDAFMFAFTKLKRIRYEDSDS